MLRFLRGKRCRRLREMRAADSQVCRDHSRQAPLFSQNTGQGQWQRVRAQRQINHGAGFLTWLHFDFSFVRCHTCVAGTCQARCLGVGGGGWLLFLEKACWCKSQAVPLEKEGICGWRREVSGVEGTLESL